MVASTAGISVGVGVMDVVLSELRHAAGFYFAVTCKGDTYV
jgi:imidazoleglycerol phosphate dehydratase HisB